MVGMIWKIGDRMWKIVDRMWKIVGSIRYIVGSIRYRNKPLDRKLDEVVMKQGE